MNKYGEITLCKKGFLQDCIGQAIDEAVEERTIQCTVDSIGRSEWSTAQQRQGLGGQRPRLLDDGAGSQRLRND